MNARAVSVTISDGISEWLRRSIWVDHLMLAIRIAVAVVVLVGLAGG